MARQPWRMGRRLLAKWLPISMLSIVLLSGMSALGWESDVDTPVALKAGAMHDYDVLPEILDEWMVDVSPLQEPDDAENMPKVVEPQARREPMPSVEKICISLRTILPHFDLSPDQLPTRLRKQLCRRVRTYAVRYRRNIQAMLNRADPHLPMIKRILRRYGLPTYYAYVPLVESAFRVNATHGRSGARGLWQLLRSTARARGLTVSKARDERLHPRRSTEAAVSYLAYLHGRFGDYGPLYVLAAYNYGETNLSRKMRRCRPTNVVSLQRPGCLPAETREYLLRMLTMWVIAADPERFHFALNESADSLSLEAASRKEPPMGIMAESGDTQK